jgi:hypothetical protein
MISDSDPQKKTLISLSFYPRQKDDDDDDDDNRFMANTHNYNYNLIIMTGAVVTATKSVSATMPSDVKRHTTSHSAHTQ